MKRFFYSFFLFLCISAPMAAQDSPTTLFGSLDNVRITGFGGPIVGFGVLDGTATVFSGGGGAVMFNNFFFGGYGSNMVVPSVNRSINGIDYRLRTQHGGLWTGYDIQAHRLIHFTTSVKFGWGRLRFYTPGASFFNDGHSALDERFVMITPEVGVEVNITRFMKVAFTGGYNTAFYNAISADDGSPINLNGQYGTITFKFGWFGKRGPLRELQDIIRN
ncbi:MAG TPA: hypothetical protein DCS93_09420 [Microscillaceae bacterium]|nr:hypothetical protein [Microscillaceae bacterium]